MVSIAHIMNAISIDSVKFTHTLQSFTLVNSKKLTGAAHPGDQAVSSSSKFNLTGAS